MRTFQKQRRKQKEKEGGKEAFLLQIFFEFRVFSGNVPNN